MRATRHFTKSDLIAVERPPIHPTAVFNIKQAAAVMDLSDKTLEQMITNRKIRHIRTEGGGRVLLTGQHLLDWLQKHEVPEEGWEAEPLRLAS